MFASVGQRHLEILVVYQHSSPPPPLPRGLSSYAGTGLQGTLGSVPLQQPVLDTSLTGPQAWLLILLTLFRLNLAPAPALPVAGLHPCPSRPRGPLACGIRTHLIVMIWPKSSS